MEPTEKGTQGGKTGAGSGVASDLDRPEPLVFEAERVRRFLPHREPILFLDRVLYLEPGKRAAATASLGAAGSAPLAGLQGEQLPRVLLVEVLAQLGGVLLGVDVVRAGRTREGDPLPGVLASVQDFELAGPVDGAAPLTVWIEVERRVGRLTVFSGEVSSGARRVARGRVSLAVGVES
jgi:predicted hotdog family 3-hydroxylacyl-ACP dehydratase